MFSYRKCIKLNLQFSHEDSNTHIESLPFQDGLKKFLGTTLLSTFGFSCPILPLTLNPNQATELSFNVTNFEKAELSCSLLIKVSLYTWSWDKTIGLCSTVARLKKTNYKLFLLIGVSIYTCSWVQRTVKLILNIFWSISENRFYFRLFLAMFDSSCPILLLISNQVNQPSFRLTIFTKNNHQ